ncbi:MAG: hypothetical protein A3K67_07650, partial [Euryarchaeota archaeon RBG_16_62_10]
TAFRLFEAAGADTDPKTLMVRIPESLAKETVRKAPSEFHLYGRDPSYRLHMGDRKVHFSIAGQAAKIHDLDGRIRSGTVKDAEDVARLADACEHVHHVSIGTTPLDVPDDMHPHHHLLANWKNSVKTSDGYNYGGSTTREIVEMAAILRGGEDDLRKKPTLLGFTNPVSPMQLSKELIEGALVHAEYNQPMLYAPEALAGGTAPATLAGLIVQQNAEVLSGIMVSQLANPGTPVMYGTVSAVLDMRTGAAALGGPEVGLFNVVAAQLARYYGLPSRGTGGNTDSKTVDAQAGAETSSSLLMAAMAGMNFIYDAAGSLEGSLTMSLEKIVIDNELCGMVSRVLAGVDVTDETLAVGEIVRTGPSASYLGTPFTVAKFRKEHFIPGLFDRRTRGSWEKAGARDISAAARARAHEILTKHEPEPMDRAVLSELERFVKKTAKAHGH